MSNIIEEKLPNKENVVEDTTLIDDRIDCGNDELSKRESTKLTLRTIKSGDPSAWTPIAASDEMTSETNSVSDKSNV